MTDAHRFILQELVEQLVRAAEVCRTRSESHEHAGETVEAEKFRNRRLKNLASADAVRSVLKAAGPKKEAAKGKPFTPPSDADCVLYGEEIGLPKSEAMRFHDHFQSNGWKVSGKAPMKDWQSAMRNWMRSWKDRQPAAKRPNLPPPPQRPK